MTEIPLFDDVSLSRRIDTTIGILKSSKVFTWGGFVTVTGFSNTGDILDVSYDQSGLGVSGGRYDNQIDYFNDGTSEKLAFDFTDINGDSAIIEGTFKITLSNLYSGSLENGFNERAQLLVYDADGHLIRQPILGIGNGVKVGDGEYEFTIDLGTTGVSHIEIQGVSYYGGKTNASGESSDIAVKGMEFNFTEGTPVTKSVEPYAPGVVTLQDVAVTAEAVRLKPGDDIAAEIAAHPEGTTFILEKGVYYGQHDLRAKDGQTFIGEGDGTEVVFKGSKVYESSGWTLENGVWHIGGVHLSDTAAPTDKSVGENVDTFGSEITRTKQDLFINDTLYQRVGSMSELTARTFYQDGDTVYISGDNPDPRGSLTEIGYHGNLFKNGGAGVTLQNFTVEYYANTNMTGAIDIRNAGADWKLLDMNVQYNHGSGVNAGLHTVVEGGNYVHNGMYGFQIGKDNVVLDGVNVSYNSYAGYTWDGGLKFVGADGVIIRNSYFTGNEGVALWGDVHSTNALIENNHTIANEEAGIFFEILQGGNQALFNVSLLNQSIVQIGSYNSAGSTISHNLVASGNDSFGIVAFNADRSKFAGGDPDLFYTFDNVLTGNTVLHTAVGLGRDGFTLGKTPPSPVTVTIDENQYIITDGDSFKHFIYDNPTGKETDPGNRYFSEPTAKGFEENGALTTMADPTDYLRSLGLDAYVDGTPPDPMMGTVRDDILTGTAGSDVIMDGGGNDTVYGGEGSDVLINGDGDDVLIGGKGVDFIQLGKGSDTIVLRSFSEAGDTLFHFDVDNDSLMISDILKQAGRTLQDLYLEKVNLHHTNLMLDMGDSDVVVAQFVQPERSFLLSDLLLL